jgi:nucleoside 2-deoxyribosyltransferase
MKKGTYFISSRWRNRDLVLTLVKSLREKGQKVLSFFENPHNSDAADDDPEEVMKKWESMPNWQQEKIVKQIFEEDMRCIRKSDTVILLLPAGISAHVEIGFAHGLNKKCILIGKPEKTESAYMIFNETYDSIEDFIKSIK